MRVHKLGCSIVVLALMGSWLPSVVANCDQVFNCEALFPDDDGNVYYFDMASLCNPISDWHRNDNNFTYEFNICGKALAKCLPRWTNHVEYGVAVQFWGATPPCNETNPGCVDLVTGEKTCCTADCEVIGTGVPMIRPWDKNNPATGGINITHSSIPPDNTAPHQCPLDPLGETPSRQVTYHVQCDASRPKGQPVMIKAWEEPSCHYHISLKAMEGCGCVRQCYGKDCGSDGCGGYCNSNPNGACPNGEDCLEGVCCTPDCHNKDCGSDGCGGACGNYNGGCPSNYICEIKEQICQETPSHTPTPSVMPSPLVKYKSSGGAIAGSYFGGVATVLFVIGGIVVFRVVMLKRRGGEVSRHSLLGSSTSAAPIASGVGTGGGGSSSASGKSAAPTPNPYDYGT